MLKYNEELIYHMHRYPIKVILNAIKDYDVRLICFGSTVKGSARWNSDIDLAFLTKDKETSKEVFRLLSTVKWNEDYPQFRLDIINMERLNNKPSTVDAINSGMLLRDFNK